MDCRTKAGCSLMMCLAALLGGCAAPAPFPPVDALPASADLPDPLVMFDGSPVRTRRQWSARRAELAGLFQHYMYGTMPAPPPLRADVRFEDPSYLDGKITLREIAIGLTPDADGPTMHLLVATPNDAEGPVPCFIMPNFGGNHTLVTSEQVAIPAASAPRPRQGQEAESPASPRRGNRPGRCPIDLIVPRGYAVAVFNYREVENDDPAASRGVRTWYARHEGDAGYTWGAVAAWAWGISRGVDWLVTDPRIDPSAIISVGHSRNGKAALVAAAFDERIAMAIPNQSGCGGAGPSRTGDTVSENVEQINRVFPHWFSPVFHQFSDQPERLPFDQHCLIAMVAPRPVLLSCADQDQWANPDGQFRMLQAADKVYRLLGAEGLAADAMPPLEHLIDSPLGYWIRPGRHSLGSAEWDIYIRYADRRLAR
ncbi:MAG: acetylxylan esterase [Planctomycetes bacterium]|nr:acetylxylan esterase [Planctomycetota bacterium]